MHDADHVLANLDLAFIGCEVYIDGVVISDVMGMEDLHFPR